MDEDKARINDRLLSDMNIVPQSHIVDYHVPDYISEPITFCLDRVIRQLMKEHPYIESIKYHVSYNDKLPEERT